MATRLPFLPRNFKSKALLLIQMMPKSTFESVNGPTGGDNDLASGDKFRLKNSEYEIQIQSGADVYESWRRTGERWFFVPHGDLTFNVRYLDTRPSRKDCPLALLLPGAAGSFADYEKIVEAMHAHGMRILSPIFPQFPQYRLPRYRNTTEERRAFLKAFLKKLQVQRIDMIMTHSSSIYASVHLCLDSELEVRSAAFFNPTGYLLLEINRPWYLQYFLTNLMHMPGFFSLRKLIAWPLVKLARSPHNVLEEIDGVLDSATIVNYSNYWQTKGLFQAYAKLGLPTLVASCRGDKIATAERTEELVQVLGVDKDSAFEYDGDLTLLKKGKIQNNVKVIFVKKKSHFIFKAFPEFVFKELLDLLKSNSLLSKH